MEVEQIKILMSLFTFYVYRLRQGLDGNGRPLLIKNWMRKEIYSGRQIVKN